MRAGLLRCGFDGGGISVETVFPTWTARDLTQTALDRILKPIPLKSQVSKSSVCIVGDQGCGKSWLLRHICMLAVEKYGHDSVHIINADDIRVALQQLDDRPVQIVIVDDAMTNASSREVYRQTEIVKTYNRSRHVYEEKLAGKPGLIIYLWAWQRFGELDPAFRQADVMIFKTGIGEPSEMRLIEGFLGKSYTEYLRSRIWDPMTKGVNSVKSVSVVRISSMGLPAGVGIFRSAPTDFVLPELLRSEDFFKDEDEEAVILDRYRGDEVWSKRIACYELSAAGRKQVDIAEELGVRQGYVSEAIGKVKALLSKK